MPRPTIGQTLHFVVVGSITEPPGGTWAESDGLIGMIYNTQVPIDSVQVPSPYGWTYNGAPSLRAGLDNTGTKTPAVTGWNAFKAAREAGNPGINPLLGFYKGIYSFKDEAFAAGRMRWPPANFFPFGDSQRLS